MKRSVFEKKFGIRLDDVHINPLEAFEDYYFNRHTGSDVCWNYRISAIKRCIKEKVSFTSTCNSNFDMAKMFLEIKCPSCRRKIKPIGGGGSGHSYTHDFTCKCGTKISVTIPENGISVKMKEEWL